MISCRYSSENAKLIILDLFSGINNLVAALIWRVEFMKSLIMFVLFLQFTLLLFALPGEITVSGNAIRFPGEKVANEFIDSNGDLALKLIITTEIKANLTFETESGILETDHPAEGRWDVYTSAKDQRIWIEANGFNRSEIAFQEIGIKNPASGDVYIFSIEGEPDQNMVNCILATIPQNVKVFIDGEFMGNTHHGLLSFMLQKGSHKLTLSAEDYMTMEKDLDFVDNLTKLNYVLAPEEDSRQEVFVNQYDDRTRGYAELDISDLGLEMVYVKGGTYRMGVSDSKDYFLRAHEVELNDYYIGKYEVTQKQYRLVMKDNPSYFLSDGQNRPVETVSWYEAVEFCNRLSESEGLERCYLINGKDVSWNENANGYRLPTEAEWEYAAKGGHKRTDTKYPGTDRVKNCAWFAGNSISESKNVGEKDSNELGLCDMGGNVWEWCYDWYSIYPKTKETNPKGANLSKYRVSRGGSWYSSPWNCSCTNRDCDIPEKQSSNLGFRVVRNSN